VSYHLYHIENDPQLRAILCMVPSINLTSHGHFLAYDEALEMFGVKFVKQNMTRIPADKEELKLRIRATQLEKERTDMLICDYINDSVQSSQPRHIQSRKEKIWELAHLLIDAFESANPSKHPIFEFCSNLNSEGIDKLFTAYDIGVERLQTIVNQEILLTEKHTTVGRKARNITRVIVADINKLRKGKKGEEEKIEKWEDQGVDQGVDQEVDQEVNQGGEDKGILTKRRQMKIINKLKIK